MIRVCVILICAFATLGVPVYASADTTSTISDLLRQIETLRAQVLKLQESIQDKDSASDDDFCDAFSESVIGSFSRKTSAKNTSSVKHLQTFLKGENTKKLEVTGVMDEPTIIALKRFQKDRGITQNRNVDTATWRRIRAIACNEPVDSQRITIDSVRASQNEDVLNVIIKGTQLDYVRGVSLYGTSQPLVKVSIDTQENDIIKGSVNISKLTGQYEGEAFISIKTRDGASEVAPVFLKYATPQRSVTSENPPSVRDVTFNHSDIQEGDRYTASFAFNILGDRRNLSLEVTPDVQCAEEDARFVPTCARYRFDINQHRGTSFTGVLAASQASNGGIYQFASSTGSPISFKIYKESSSKNNPAVYVEPYALDYTFRFVDRLSRKVVWEKEYLVYFKDGSVEESEANTR